jgi:TatD DNase family protein
LLQRGARRVQLHAFDGKTSAALPAVEAGFFFSIPPSVTRSRQKQKLVRGLPLDCLLLETDSPVLGPDPAVRNEPASAATSARVIAEIKGIRLESVLEQTLENTLTLYGSGLLAPAVAAADAGSRRGGGHAGAA